MYEFLAPWGALIPAISAYIVYAVVTELRWRQALEQIEEPS